MERVNRALAESVRALLSLHRQEDGSYILPHDVSAEGLMALMHTALGDEVVRFENAGDVVWEIARYEGYVIPACPAESSGDAHAFLKQEGVSNSSEWYIKRGFSDEEMHKMYAAAAFVARNQKFWRKIIPVPKKALTIASDVVPYIFQAIDFALGDETNKTNQTIFMC